MVKLTRNSSFFKLAGLAILIFLLVLSLKSNASRIQYNMKMGFGISSPADAEKWAARLGSGWYIDWGSSDRSARDIPEIWQMIRLNSKGTTPPMEDIKLLARKFPGHIWIIGNEPDNLLQDAIHPDDFAKQYHLLYYAIKSADSSARIAMPGVTLPSPLRMTYLSQILDVYNQIYSATLPVDIWTIHNYILREENGSWGAGIPPGISAPTGLLYEIEDHGRTELFSQQIINFRTWMKTKGYQHLPLVVTEYGILLPESFGYTREFTAQFLQETCEWMMFSRDTQIGYPGDDFHLVQGWNWFSLSDPFFPVSNLADLNEDELTLIGESFRNCAQK